MDPDGYTPEQRQLQRTVREFARREIAPGARDRDRTGQFDYALHRRIGEIGLPGLTFPAELGGAAAETLSFCLAIDEVSRVDLSIALTLWVGIQGGQTLLRASAHGNPEWIDQYVRPIVSGEMVGAGAITEPDAGSDTAAIRTRAVLDGNDWVIDGALASQMQCTMIEAIAAAALEQDPTAHDAVRSWADRRGAAIGSTRLRVGYVDIVAMPA